MSAAMRLILVCAIVWSALDLAFHGRPISSGELTNILWLAMGAAVRPYFERGQP